MKIGQKYSFEIDGEHPSPYFVVCEIDEHKESKIISIYIGGLEFKNPHTVSGFGSEISHAPCDFQSLLDSNPILIDDSVELPDYLDGYDTWKKAFDSGEAGVFTIPPEKIVEYIVDVING